MSDASNLIEYMESIEGPNIKFTPLQKTIIKALVSKQEDAFPYVGEVLSIIEFVESEEGMGYKLYPAQKVILKVLYGIPLDDRVKCIKIQNFRGLTFAHLTESDYLKYLYHTERCNIETVEKGLRLHNFVFVSGRRGGKTLLDRCIKTYEIYLFLMKADPSSYYGIPCDDVHFTSIGTCHEMAGIQNEQFIRSVSSGKTLRLEKEKDRPLKVFLNAKKGCSNSVSAVSQGAASRFIFEGSRNLFCSLDEMVHFNNVDVSLLISDFEASAHQFRPQTDQPLERRLNMVSSPLYEDGVFYERFKAGFGKPNTLCIQIPTWEVNPTIPFDQLIAWHDREPETFHCEFGARFMPVKTG